MHDLEKMNFDSEKGTPYKEVDVYMDKKINLKKSTDEEISANTAESNELHEETASANIQADTSVNEQKNESQAGEKTINNGEQAFSSAQPVNEQQGFTEAPPVKTPQFENKSPDYSYEPRQEQPHYEQTESEYRRYERPEYNENYRGYPYGSASQHDDGHGKFYNPQQDIFEGYNGNYGAEYNNGFPNRWDPKPNEKGTSGLAIASFVLALVNLIVFKSILSIIIVPLCLVFSIISLSKKFGGKGWAIGGIVVSIISAFIFGSAVAIALKVLPDFKYLAENQKQIIEEYEKDGTIPERFEKYNSPRFEKYWKSMGYDSFDEFFGALLDSITEKKNNAFSEEFFSDEDYVNDNFNVKEVAFT